MLVGLAVASPLSVSPLSAVYKGLPHLVSPRSGELSQPNQAQGEGGNGTLSPTGVCSLLFQISSNVTVPGIVSDFNAVENDYGGYVGATFTLTVMNPNQQAPSTVQVILYAYGPQPPAYPDADEPSPRLYEGYVPQDNDSVFVNGLQWDSSPNCGQYAGPYIQAVAITKSQTQLAQSPPQTAPSDSTPVSADQNKVLSPKHRPPAEVLNLGPQEMPYVLTNVKVAPPTGLEPWGAIDGSGTFEPAVANNGNTVFYTGNYIATRSTDGGSTWTFVDPTVDILGKKPPVYRFCCDQDVVFDPTNKIFLWYRQEWPNSANENLNLLDVSTDASAWCEYAFYPKSFTSSWAGSWFDYNHLALSPNYLYLSTNRYPHKPPDSSDRQSVIIRFSLSQLAACATAGWNYFASTSTGTWGPVDGASTVMYWAGHKDTSTLRVFDWRESVDWTGIKQGDYSHPSYEATDKKGNAHCPDLSGSDICYRIDDRVLGGWYTNPYGSADLGFVWNVKEGGGFPYPHTYVSVIRYSSSEGKWKYYATQTLWVKDGALVYAAVAPLPSLGHVGAAMFFSGPSSYPSMILGYYGYTTGWGIPPSLLTVTPGTSGIFSGGVACSVQCWGDYLRVRADSGNGIKWVAAGYTMAGGTSGFLAGTGLSLEPRYYVFCAPVILPNSNEGPCQGQFTTTQATSAFTTGYTPTTQTTSYSNTILSSSSNVRVSSTSSVSGLEYDPNRGLINFTTNGPDGTIGSTEVVFTKNLISGDPVLLIDDGVGAVTSATLDSNSTHYFFSFSYHQSQHRVTIGGTTTVPEFGQQTYLWMVPFLIAATVIAVKLSSRRRNPR